MEPGPKPSGGASIIRGRDQISWSMSTRAMAHPQTSQSLGVLSFWVFGFRVLGLGFLGLGLLGLGFLGLGFWVFEFRV